MILRRTAFYSIIFVLSLLCALIGSYVYGKVFQHKRYWEGTIVRVQETNIKMIEGLLAFENADQFFLKNTKNLQALFGPLAGKISINVSRGESLIYSNHFDNYEVRETKEIIFLDSNLSVKISTYIPPRWNKNYLSWISQPKKWFTPRFDYITFPFVGLVLIFMATFAALAWGYRSAHLSFEVLKVLRDIEKNDAAY